MAEKPKIVLSDAAKEIIKEVTTQEAVVKEDLSDETARAFNLAAFAFPVLYNCLYKRIWFALIFVGLTVASHLAENFTNYVTYMPVMNAIAIATLVLAIISGATGNVAAYDARNYDNENDFIKTQKIWTIFAVIAIIVHLCLIPVQKAGHYNNAQMLKLKDTRTVLQNMINKAIEDDYELGKNVEYTEIPELLSQYIKNGKFDGNSKITTQNGVTYQIVGYENDCGTIAANSYHEDKTACAVITVDLNTSKDKKYRSEMDDIKASKGALSNTKRLGDIFMFYVYSDGITVKEGSIEQYIFRKFNKE